MIDIPALDDDVNFLVCVDKAAESRTALMFACMRAIHCDSRVTLLHVVEPPFTESIFSIADKMTEESIEEGEALLEEMKKEAVEMMGVEPTTILYEGAVGDSILEHANSDKCSANLLVVGVASNNAARGKLTSYLSSQVGDELHIPLVLVPGNLTQEEIAKLA